jgi:hypothetical protein
MTAAVLILAAYAPDIGQREAGDLHPECGILRSRASPNP